MGKETKVILEITDGVFKGLAKQNLLFHQCIIELVDNAVAARSDEPFRIDIQFDALEDEDYVNVYVGDKGIGMDLETLKKALQIGESATKEDRLNEHGFGLKNSLATLTKGEDPFMIWTRSNDGEVHTVKGPFSKEMTILSEKKEMPGIPYLDETYSTIVKAKVRRSFIQTVQGRGARTENLVPLRLWLIEHLGVTYRGYLKEDYSIGEPLGRIFVHIKKDSKRVPVLEVPMASREVERFSIELSGHEYDLEYRYGVIDRVKVNDMLFGEKMKYYYQQNQGSQGIDIRLGKRTIATRQLENIWRKQSAKGEFLDEAIRRHNNLNDFTGELIIPDLPRGVLTTINNKTDFNLDDPDWIKIFNKLNDYRPIRDIKSTTEKNLKEKLVDRIESINHGYSVSTERSVWQTGTRIDVFVETNHEEVRIYEVKLGRGSSLDLYQLKMYWDGLLNEGIQPNEGILVVEDYSENLKFMLDVINEKMKPMAPNGSEKYKKYNLMIRTYNELSLDR